ncbi:MAG: hypothetical protein H0T62_08475 [Parachlamydiaceae bacterium]|nr:hypothetical protein [Parachlamydiaceae bacterium]
MQEAFPTVEKMDSGVKMSSIAKKNFKPAQTAHQKKKVVQNQTSKAQKQKTPQKFEINPKSIDIDNNEALDLTKKENNAELVPFSEKCQKAKIHNDPQEVSTEKIHTANLQNKTVLSPSSIPLKTPLFQYPIESRNGWKKSLHLKIETYLYLCEEEKFKQKVYHGFSLKVDEFFKDYSFEAEWDNLKTHSNDRLFCI